jgi:hypothetical protein
MNRPHSYEAKVKPAHLRAVHTENVRVPHIYVVAAVSELLDGIMRFEALGEGVAVGLKRRAGL